jgi:hypothetical protein
VISGIHNNCCTFGFGSIQILVVGVVVEESKVSTTIVSDTSATTNASVCLFVFCWGVVGRIGPCRGVSATA